MTIIFVYELHNSFSVIWEQRQAFLGS